MTADEDGVCRFRVVGHLSDAKDGTQEWPKQRAPIHDDARTHPKRGSR